MPSKSHDATRGVFNTWYAETRKAMGGKLDWTKVSEKEIRSLSEKMFDAAKVPEKMRKEYWDWFDRMKDALQKAK